MKPATAEWILTWLLRLDGVLMSCAALAVFFPDALMHWLHARLQLGTMPDGPVTEYLARSCSALYAMHGLIVFHVALRPRSCWRLVRWITILHMLLGLTILGIDLAAGMPAYWTAGEGPPIVALAAFTFWLWHRADGESSLPKQGLVQENPG